MSDFKENADEESGGGWPVQGMLGFSAPDEDAVASPACGEECELVSPLLWECGGCDHVWNQQEMDSPTAQDE